MSDACFYKWRAKYSGMDTPMMALMKEKECWRLKKMYAESKMDAGILQEVMEKSSQDIYAKEMGLLYFLANQVLKNNSRY